MTAPVRIEAEAWNDVRFRTLARHLGFADGLHALIRCAVLWSWQAENYTPETPTYVVDADTIESALEAPGAADAMVRAKLAEAVPEGFRIRGAEGRIEWLWKKRLAARAGGEAKKRKTDNKDKPHGYPIGLPSAKPSGDPDACPLVIVLPEELSPARAIQPSTDPAPPGESAWHRRARWWGAMLEADQRLRSHGIEPSAPPLPKAPAGSNELNMSRCERQLLDGGLSAPEVDARMRHIVLVAEAEAVRVGHRRWFKPAMIWDPERAARAADTSLEEAASPRDGPSRSASRASAEPVRKIRTLS